MMFNSQERKINFGLLVIRTGLAAVLLMHALPKFIGGSANWQRIAADFSYINPGLPAEAFGFVILLLESLGGLSLLCGYLFRTFCVLMAGVFGLYCFNYFNMNGYITLTLFSLALATVFLGLLNTGPGRYAVAVKVEKK